MSDPQRETQVQIQCKELEAVCNMLHQSVDRLNERLSVLIRPQEVRPQSTDDSEKRPQLVPHAAFLRSMVESIRDVHVELGDTQQRLEI